MKKINQCKVIKTHGCVATYECGQSHAVWFPHFHDGRLIETKTMTEEEEWRQVVMEENARGERECLESLYAEMEEDKGR